MKLMPSYSIAAVAAAICFASPSFTAMADDLKCNKEQTRCQTSSTQMTIGDEVGIFNKEGELVATGEIKSMNGDRRAVLINKRHGQINQGYKLVLLGKSPSSEDFNSVYKIYREPSRVNVGAELGLSSVGIGDGSPATEVSGYGAWRSWRGIQIVGRATYMMMEGTISGYDPTGTFGTRPISLSGIGLLGGAAYTLRENKPISFRGELGLGFMYMNAKIDGDPSLIKDNAYNSKVDNGFGLYSRAAIGTMYNMGNWHIHLDVAGSLIHRAMASTLLTGVSMDLR